MPFLPKKIIDQNLFDSGTSSWGNTERGKRNDLI